MRWMRRFQTALGAMLLFGATLSEPHVAAAQSGPEVDVALVLAVDVSFSMDLEELALQRAGYVEALRSPEVHKAIAQGVTGKVAVTYFEWAGDDVQHLLIPWTVIDSAETALAVAATLEKQGTMRGRRTSISAAIDFSVKQFDIVPARPLKQVIDISGDGPNNSGRFVTVARDEAVRKGITINGLPITLRRPGYLDIDDLDRYYNDCVIGGQGAFMLSINSKEQFAETIRTKIVMEISDAPPLSSLIKRVNDAAPVNCMAGEQMWRDRMRN